MNLALTLKQGGNLLLLDEPANDLDVETLSSLENALLEFPGCAVITSHDRWFLDRIATHILAWEGGANWFWFEGNFESYEKNKIERLGAEAARPHRVTYRKLNSLTGAANMHDEAEEAVHYAERIVWAAGWRMQEARVLRHLARTAGLACGRLEPRSDVIQLVTYDGEHLGHVRRDGSSGPDERWVAVPKNPAGWPPMMTLRSGPLGHSLSRPARCHRTLKEAAVRRLGGRTPRPKPEENQRMSRSSSRSRRDRGTSTRWIMTAAGSGWTGCCSRQPGIRSTTWLHPGHAGRRLGSAGRNRAAG